VLGVARNILISAAQSRWLRDHAPRWRFVRRASKRFLPGERAEDALAAAKELAALGISAMPSRVGENITVSAEAEAVAEHYVGVLAGLRAAKLPGSLSVKPTQLGLDLDAEHCYRNLAHILDASDKSGIIWIDMESSAYTDRTLELFRRGRAAYPNVGVCLQAYLKRTPADLASLLPLGPAIRLVKGAYAEPSTIAFAAKREVDDAFFAITQTLFSPQALGTGTRPAIATHDTDMIARTIKLAKSRSVAPLRYEFQMLYGIRREAQKQLARDGFRVSVLISYGTYWFPWYMRRLAERPANVWFVLRNLFG
jgi:proline dehydrogenase